jgi:hypothetical protein
MQPEETETPYDKWYNSYHRKADHLILSAILSDYYDNIDTLIVDYCEEDNHFTFANDMFKLEMEFQRNLALNCVWDLYLLMQDKNSYIAALKK